MRNSGLPRLCALSYLSVPLREFRILVEAILGELDASEAADSGNARHPQRRRSSGPAPVSREMPPRGRLAHRW